MTERELFIKNYKKYVNNNADFTILNETENTFYDDQVDEAWVMWQLSANREGYKLVPVEPTQAMLDSARDWSTKKYGKAVGNDGASGCYKAMIGAIE